MEEETQVLSLSKMLSKGMELSSCIEEGEESGGGRGVGRAGWQRVMKEGGI